MTCFKPATPGFVVTLVATILLVFVSFGVPWIKSVYFLKATVKGFDGELLFGTLGYCLKQANGTTCSKPSVGYEIGTAQLVIIPTLILKIHSRHKHTFRQQHCHSNPQRRRQMDHILLGSPHRCPWTLRRFFRIRSSCTLRRICRNMLQHMCCRFFGHSRPPRFHLRHRFVSPHQVEDQ